MSVLENFKNIPRSPYGGRQGSNVIFFLQICNEVPGEKKRGGACRPPNGRQAPVAHPRGDHPVGPPGGPVAPPAGDRGGAVAPPHGRQAALFFFLQGLRCKFEEKKITFEPCRPP